MNVYIVYRKYLIKSFGYYYYYYYLKFFTLAYQPISIKNIVFS
jgi:hypothetical protein